MDNDNAVPLSRVALGLGFVFTGLALQVLLWYTGLVLYAFTTPSPVIAFVLLAALVLGGLVHLFGQLLCLWVPREAEAGRVLALAIGLNVLSKAVSVGDFLNSFGGWWSFSHDVLVVSQAALVLSVASSLVFLVFLKRLARFLTYGDGEVEAEALLFLWGLCIFLYLGTFGVIVLAAWSLGGDDLPTRLFGTDFSAVSFLILLLVLFLLLLIFVLLTFIKYCRLLTALREVIVKQLERAADERKGKKTGLQPS